MGRSKRIKKNKTSTFEKRKPLFFILILTILVILSFAKTTKFEFVNIDDNYLIYQNRLVTDSSVPWSKCFVRYLYKAHYKPLVFVTWKAEHFIFGGSPWHFHLFNWLLHLANTIFVFLIGQIMFKRLYDDEKQINWSAFALALLFAINPLRIESVAWATERKDVLFAFFFLLSWFAYLKYILKGKFLFLMIAAILYLFSGLSKSMGITLIGVLALIDLIYRRKIDFKLLLEKVPFIISLFILFYLYGFLEFGFTSETLVNLEGVEDPGGLEIDPNTGKITSLAYLNALPYKLQMIISASTRFILWIVHIFVPVKLAIIYPHDQIFAFLGKTIFATPFVILAGFIVAWIRRKRSWAALVGLLFYTITISPALALGSSGQGIFLSDRYTYIPTIGLFFILVVFLNFIKRNNRNLSNLLFVSISFFFLISTLVNVNHWKNSETLFSHAIDVDSKSAFAYNNRGHYYRQNNQIDKALEDYNRCLAYSPDFHRAYFNRGKIYFDRGEIDLALVDFNKCLSIDPYFANALSNRGAAYGMKKQYDLALADLDKAIEYEPFNSNALSNRGYVHYVMGNFEKTIDDYKKFLNRKPNNADIINTVGLCYMQLEDINKAMTEFNRSIKINPAKGTYYLNRSYAFNKSGDKINALKDVKKARQLGTKINPQYLNYLIKNE